MDTALVSIAVLLRIFSNPLGNVFQKQLTTKGIHPLFVNFQTYFLLSIVCLFIAAFINWPVLPRQFWVYSVFGGIAGALGNGFLVKALQNGELSVLGPVNSYKSVVGYALSLFQLSTIVSVLLGYRFFKERDIRKKLIGSAIMIIGSIVIIFLKND